MLNHNDNLLSRAQILQNASNDINKQAACIDLCKRENGILNFFNFFLFTYDPRQQVKDLPFIPYDYQQTYILEINELIEKGENGLTEKSRDMGVTWMVLGVFLYRWLVHNESFLLGSRKEEMVDTLGDMTTLFERLRYMLAKLPDWFVTLCGYDRQDNAYMRLFKKNGASLVGESMNQDFSRQGRYKAILLDEFAFVEKAEVIWRACGDSSPCKLPVSTPNGRNNFFAVLRDSGKIKVFTLDWRKHPNKDSAWYALQCATRSAKDVAQEIDINYTVSAGDPFYNGFSRGLHVRKMNILREIPITLSWDFGFTHPNCSLHQINSEGIWVIVDNIFGENQTIEEFGAYVSTYLNEHYFDYQFKCGFCDPAGSQRSDKSKMSSVQILEKQGWGKLRFLPSNTPQTNYTARKSIIERKLKTLISGIPSLVVNDTINNYIIIEGFEGGYRYPDATKYGGIKEHPVEDGYFEHCMNTVEYFAINTFRPVDKPKEEKFKNRIRYYDNQPVVNAGISF